MIDVAPTVLEAARLPAPTFVDGIQQAPLEGVSMAYSFDDANAADRHTTQYFEMFVNRGIYHQGWTAVTRHSTPWVMAALPAIDSDVWELYGPDDWTQAHNLAAEQPEKLAHLQRLFLIEATKYNVLPLDDRRVERFNSDMAGRPQLVHGNRQVLFGGMGRLSENSILVLNNKSHAITADLVVPDSGARGVIVSQGGAFGGWTGVRPRGPARLLLQPVRAATLQGLRRQPDTGRRPPGPRRVCVRRRRIGQGRDSEVVRGRFAGRGGPGCGAVPMAFSADETCDVGSDTATPVTDDIREGETEFNGRIRWVELSIGDDAEDADHLISPDERYRLAMARQ